MKRVLSYILILGLGGCLHRYVDPPAPIDEGSFLVHVVRAPDESFPKILTWYTGTTLSQEIVLRYNPVLMTRELKVGDRILIPQELVANLNSYGTAPHTAQSNPPNLLMGESEPEQTIARPSQVIQPVSTPASKPREGAPGDDSLPAMPLETFGEEISPDRTEESEEGRSSLTAQEVQGAPSRGEQPQPPQPTSAGESDMPPPGLLEEYAGS